MDTISIQQIKQELATATTKELYDYCLQLAAFKKENKEFLGYLLFQKNDELAFIEAAKADMETGFESVNTTNVFFAKKTIRKVLRLAKKQIRFTRSSTVEIELLLHFCSQLNQCDIHYEKYPVLMNLYQNQLKRAEKMIAGLHEDLQYDYRKLLDAV